MSGSLGGRKPAKRGQSITRNYVCLQTRDSNAEPWGTLARELLHDDGRRTEVPADGYVYKIGEYAQKLQLLMERWINAQYFGNVQWRIAVVPWELDYA